MVRNVATFSTRIPRRLTLERRGKRLGDTAADHSSSAAPSTTDRTRAGEGERPDVLARVLESGLMAVVLLGPLPFGAVTPKGRLALEAASVLLGVLWLARAVIRGNALPPRMVRLGVAGLLLVATVQILPLPRSWISWISPTGTVIRQDSQPPGAILQIERRLLGDETAGSPPRPTLSLTPESTASALRTGSAFALLFLVAVTVARECGLRRLAVALLVSAAFQALYGILVLASGHDMIWNVPKLHYLNSATGTFVNRNHFAGFLEASLPCGLALALVSAPVSRAGTTPRERLVRWLGPDGVGPLFFVVLFLVGLAGLLLSFSRAGIALGLGGLGLTFLAAGRTGLRTRFVVATLVLTIAAVPLAQIGAERLAERFADTAQDLVASGGRATVWKDTAFMILDFPVCGTGFGSFSATYPLYRSPGVRLFYDHAHNDALQFIAEGGLLSGVLLGLVLLPVAKRVVGSLSGGRTLAAGFSAGLIALLLHGLVDFNFHIPSNAALAAILAGAVLGASWNSRT